MKLFAAVFKSGEYTLPDITPTNAAKNGVNVFLAIIGIMAVGMIIFAAIRLITSSGDVEKTKTGRRALMWGIIGLAMALLAGAIVNLVMEIV